MWLAIDFQDWGILCLRMGLGGMFIYHGLPKVLGGSVEWKKLGQAMVTLGVPFLPTAWGFAAAAAELLGGVALVLGVLYVPFLVVLIATMAVAAVFHLVKGDGLVHASHAIEVGITFLAMIFLGPGPYALDDWFVNRPAPTEIGMQRSFERAGKHD
jgi:putative oxidoreductase